MIGITTDEYKFISNGDESLSDNLLNKTFQLNNIISESREPLEGCIFYRDRQTDFKEANPNPFFAKKRRNIARIAPYINSIIEVGVNGGHSALFWLSLNKNIQYYGIDICLHKYTQPASEFLKYHFKERVSF